MVTLVTMQLVALASQLWKQRKESKLCMYCLDPKDVYSVKFGHKNCQVSKTKKNRFSCTNPGCLRHCWLCTFHTNENKEKLDKFAEECSRKGLKFVFFNISLPSVGSNKNLLPTTEATLEVPPTQPPSMFQLQTLGAIPTGSENQQLPPTVLPSSEGVSVVRKSQS